MQVGGQAALRVQNLIKKKRIRLSGKALELKRDACKRLQVQGLTIKEISERMSAPYNTVLKWIYQNY